MSISHKIPGFSLWLPICCSVPLVHVEGGESDDEELVTIVEKEKIDVEKKAVIVTDKFRTVEKLLMSENLKDFLNQGKQYV